MKNIKEKITLENVLCLFLILSPIFDISSFVFRNYFNTTFSISTFIRPIIPMCILLYILIKSNKKERLIWIGIGLVYIIYGACHLLVTRKMLTGASYGDLKKELQYVFNFTFLIIYLIIYVWSFYIRKDKVSNTIKLKKSITIMTFIYIVSIFITIIFKVSSYTYIETKTGYKGFIESGNSLSAILLLSMFIMFTMINSKDVSKRFKIFDIITIIITAIYLMTIIGTRTGLFGTFLVSGLYVVLEMFYSKNKKIIACGIVLMIVGGAFVGFKGSSTIKRRQQMKESQYTIIDEKTGKVGNMTGDMLKIKNKIIDGTLEEGYMSEAQQQATLELYLFAVKHNIAGNDTRTQQLMYNIYLVKNQKSIPGILFGNGYESNYREMVMENELASMLLNFGIIGFILYVCPILAILIYSIYIGIKNFKKINVSYIMCQLALGLALVLSWMSGYVLFATSSMAVIVAISTILLKDIDEKCNVIDFEKA